jgi:hypothetical protein
MSIGIAMIGLTYLFIFVMAYVFMVYSTENTDRSDVILNKAFQYAYNILLFGLLVVLALVFLPHISLDTQMTSYLILACKFISILTLASSIFVFSNRVLKR